MRVVSGTMGPRGTSQPGLEQHLPAGTVVWPEAQGLRTPLGGILRFP